MFHCNKFKFLFSGELHSNKAINKTLAFITFHNRNNNNTNSNRSTEAELYLDCGQHIILDCAFITRRCYLCNERMKASCHRRAIDLSSLINVIRRSATLVKQLEEDHLDAL